MITTYTNNRDLKRIKDLNIPFVTNISREDVAKILGKSKVFFFPSIYESCPLVIYEALNAGCTIVSRNVGAVKEQLDGHGYIFDNNGQILKKLNKAFTNPLDYDKIIDRGIKFDRINQISKIEKELKIVEGRLKNAK
ncbi:MAG: glycosyltransferase [bacterium]